MSARHRPKGILSADPSITSWFGWVDPYEAPPTEMREGVAVVHVRGFLEHHRSLWCESYEAITDRVREALAQQPRALVLAIDSPGGLSQGNTEAARELRSLCDAAGVPLVAFVHGKATSAAYALACVASEVVVPESGLVGSIGTMIELMDVTEGDAAWGVKVHVISSGRRKLDGNPHVPQTPEALDAVRALVDSLAGVFFELVADHRPLSVDAIRMLEGAVFVGRAAVDAKLADSVATLPALIARLASGEPSPTTAPSSGAEENAAMEEEEKKARAALQAVIDDEKADDKAKARARAALAALDDKGEDTKPSEDEPAESIAAVVARLGKLEIGLAKAADAAAVKAQLDARPDLSPEQRAAFEQLTPKALADVLATIPRQKRANPAADLGANPTRGANVGGNTARVTELRSKLGIGKQPRGVVTTGTGLRIGAPLTGTTKEED